MEERGANMEMRCILMQCQNWRTFLGHQLKQGTKAGDRIKCELHDMKFVGNFYTWDNKQYQTDRIWCKLDRNLVNADWISKWPHLETEFLTSNVSDHSPALIRRSDPITKTAGNFKFLNLCTQSAIFIEEVKKVWSIDIGGHAMYRVAAKLALMKKPSKAGGEKMLC
ncbi:hypothetical protein RIF29_25481 [Crotalaria pallida]|uniref:Uncharacterized protein n=1 Tax=Crotalaria pallida TaxID=3830 RepID=A0AAN9EMB8_CROPI